MVKGDPTYLGPVSASPQICATELLDLAKVTARDVVYDLGCGDGRVVITAARERGARGVGVELDDKAVLKAKESVEREGVRDLVDILHKDVFEVDISKATVVFMYLLPTGNKSVGQKLLAECRPGTRVVTYIFKMDPSWVPYLDKVQPVSTSTSIDTTAMSKLHLYRIPEPPSAANESTNCVGSPSKATPPKMGAVSRTGVWKRNADAHNPSSFWTPKRVVWAGAVGLLLMVIGRTT
mmetsp:Transcript_37326/g.81300  ORF Transcript_37326/g.81300 Transcript_37326/m.81300 type:complete len:237 (-) Transcript_37326:578-1288(-)